MEPDRLLKRYRQRRRRSAEPASSGSSSSSSLSDATLRHNASGSAAAASDDARSGRTRRAIPHIIYPEILVIVDYDGYRLHGGDNVQVGYLQWVGLGTPLLGLGGVCECELSLNDRL